jgi:Tfp pilus assembly protein PilE
MRKNYFTLNELCVVTSIAAILVSLAFSAYSGQLKMSKKKGQFCKLYSSGSRSCSH